MGSLGDGEKNHLVLSIAYSRTGGLVSRGFSALRAGPSRRTGIAVGRALNFPVDEETAA
jgi:hypothetical protein